MAERVARGKAYISKRKAELLQEIDGKQQFLKAMSAPVSTKSEVTTTGSSSVPLIVYTLYDSDKYRSIAISSILGKILDHIIIVKQSDALTTSQHQYGFKANSSTVLCSTMVIETVQYYTENGATPVYVLLLDASKAFDKVAFNVQFNELRDRAVCPRIIKLLYFMYTNQSCSVKWDNEQSDYF